MQQSQTFQPSLSCTWYASKGFMSIRGSNPIAKDRENLLNFLTLKTLRLGKHTSHATRENSKSRLATERVVFDSNLLQKLLFLAWNLGFGFRSGGWWWSILPSCEARDCESELRVCKVCDASEESKNSDLQQRVRFATLFIHCNQTWVEFWSMRKKSKYWRWFPNVV